MAQRVLLGYDLGTTRLKVAAFDLEGRLLGITARRNPEPVDGLGRRQDPEAWWKAAGALTRELCAESAIEPGSVAAIGLSGRGGGAVFLDEAGVVVAGSWEDRRHAGQLASLVKWRAGGAHCSNYAAALLSKLQWLRDEQPADAERVRHALYAKDFLLYRMTGEAVTDPTSGPDREDWDDALLGHVGVDRDVLPRIAPPWEQAGSLGDGAAEALGLPAGVPVAVGGHDGICANVGAGAAGVGEYAITIGTHAVVRAVMESTPEGAYRFYGMPPGREIIGGNAVMAGRAADWFLDVWLNEPDEAARPAVFAQLDAQAEAIAIGSGGVRFLPFLAGQVAPELRPGASAGFVGLSGGSNRASMYRALLEGGACAMRSIFDQVSEWCGPPRRLRFTGSGARSAVWRQMIVDLVGRPAETVGGGEEARGAAIYAAIAIGEQSDLDSACAAMVRVEEVVEPQREHAAAQEDLYADWRRVNDALRGLDRASGAGR